jgi:hypothetical protein
MTLDAVVEVRQEHERVILSLFRLVVLAPEQTHEVFNPGLLTLCTTLCNYYYCPYPFRSRWTNERLTV